MKSPGESAPSKQRKPSQRAAPLAGQSSDKQPSALPPKFQLQASARQHSEIPAIHRPALSENRRADLPEQPAAFRGPAQGAQSHAQGDLANKDDKDGNQQPSGGWQIVGPRGRVLRPSNAPSRPRPSPLPRRPHPHGHPQKNKSPLAPGLTHRPVFDLDYTTLKFGMVVHTDKIEELRWSDRPAVVTGVNSVDRRVRFWCTFSYSEAGGLISKYNSEYYARHPNKEYFMRNCVLIEDGRTRPHLGTPIVRLEGGALAKTSYVDTSEVRELPLDRVSRQSVGHVLQDLWLPVDHMLRLRKHVERQGNSLVPTAEGGKLERYNGSWEGFLEYTVE
ncbi:hypothetical protein MPH_01135 [Macrophomina phaseolina MS6]|uniref:Uncharacterized protein n=1 Tax=Macrophomina phaseolina (strain MS6) TaxID=1126212 RepID=K2RGA1_MACPH|nr:hypothetical protein MPH_01135 [Macrophomina phaseolina MS6]